jgi:hypothetical protein
VKFVCHYYNAEFNRCLRTGFSHESGAEKGSN